MGSLRNPVGPLPSSIYWRRRAVLLSVVVVLALFAVWMVTSSGGGGKSKASGSDGKHPTSSITPGPSGTGPAISQHPGGRDESGGGDGSGSSGSSGSDGSGGAGSGSDSGSGGGSGDGGSGGAGGGRQLPAGSGSSLPNCTSDAVQLVLQSVRNTYAPGQTPAIQLIAKNASGSDCKADLGPKKAVVTITQTGSDSPFWSSADCPGGPGSVLFRVPANDRATYTVTWDRKPSAPNCATPPAGSASAGTYLVEAKAPGFPTAQTSFVLSRD